MEAIAAVLHLFLPADPLHVVVGAFGKDMATTASAAFQNLLPVGSSHSCSETVHANASSHFGLISPFCHCSNSFQSILILAETH